MANLDIRKKNNQDYVVRCILPDTTRKVLVENLEAIYLAAQTESLGSLDSFLAARDMLIKDIHDLLPSIAHISQVRLTEKSIITHSINVASIALVIAFRLGIKHEELRNLTFAALIHDIGKIKIPNQIVYKSDKLTPKEQDLLNLHVPLGFKICRDEFKLDPIICRLVIEHHENHDGSGYPRKFSASDTHPLSQLIHVANIFDNLSIDYRENKPRKFSDILKIILSNSTAYNPQYLYTLIHLIKLHYHY